MEILGDYGEYVRFTMGQAKNDTIDRIKTGMLYTPLTQACQTALQTFMDDVEKRLPYTYQVLDSYSKPGPDIQRGDTFWLGSYDGCMLSAQGEGGQSFAPQYCNSYVAQNDSSQILSLCVPDVCTGEDVGNYTNLLVVTLPMENMWSFAGWCQQQRPFGIASWIVMVIFVLVALLSACGTVFHVYKRKSKQSHAQEAYGMQSSAGGSAGNSPPAGNSQVQFVGADAKPDMTRGQSALLSFSWLRNGARLLDLTVKADTMTCIYGIRFISMSWIVLGHTYYFATDQIANSEDIGLAIASFSGQAIVNSGLAVDTFLVISAILVSYLTLKRIKQGTNHWGYFYFHRFWRLTPVYLFLLLFASTLFLDLLDGPQMHSLDEMAGSCMKFGVLNILYLNNLYPTINGCIGWSWYLAMDMQCYIVSPLVFYFLYRKRWLGIVFTVIAIAIPVAVVLGLAFGLGYYVVDPLGISNPIANDYIYFRPYCRSGPYIIGLVVGYLLSEGNGRIKLTKIQAAIGWCAAIVLGMASVYGLYYYQHTNTQSPLAASAFYATFHRIAFALAVSWVIVACQSGFGGPVNALLSWRVWLPLSRLTYCAYLIHPLVMFYTYFGLRRRIYGTTWTMIYYFLGHLVLSNLIAAVACLLVEYPMMSLEKVLFPCFKKSPPPQPADPDASQHSQQPDAERATNEHPTPEDGTEQTS